MPYLIFAFYSPLCKSYFLRRYEGIDVFLKLRTRGGGDPFPSVRTLSRELKINPDTAHKAILHLTNERLLEIRPCIDVERQIDFVRRDLTIPAVRLADWVVKP